MKAKFATKFSIRDSNFPSNSLFAVKPHIWLTYNGEIYNYKRLEKQFKFDYQTGKWGNFVSCLLFLHVIPSFSNRLKTFKESDSQICRATWRRRKGNEWRLKKQLTKKTNEPKSKYCHKFIPYSRCARRCRGATRRKETTAMSLLSFIHTCTWRKKKIRFMSYIP